MKEHPEFENILQFSHQMILNLLSIFTTRNGGLRKIFNIQSRDFSTIIR